ncbi:hypothetical protein CK203_110953 [Vitis vinifera]|uniref:Uncharacterized protein n=1 Tax=Vitis vinifera TaxID=29760 RepID=A0A438CUI7_VITVI|nr:hypothetical protein CK203_110953 [Vitis vinifera]
MEEAKTMKTPMSSSIKLDKDEKGKSIDFTMYRGKIDSILTRRQIHLGYLMMMHMIACCESKTRVLSYGHFLTRVFKDVGINLSKEMDFEAFNTYDTYDDQSMGMMKYEKDLDGSWVPPAPDHTPWMDLSAQINSLGTRMEELVVASNTHFYFMEDRKDRYQTSFTS